MSVVINVLTKASSIVAYDGRARDNKTNAIKSEHTRKAQLLNKYTIIGYTGLLEEAQHLVSLLRSDADIQDLRCEQVVARVLVHYGQAGLRSAKTSYLLTGLNSDGVLATYTINTDFNVDAHVPAANEIKLTRLHSNNNTIDLNSFYDSRQLRGVKPREIMKQYIEAVADIDDSVNRNVRFITLNRSDFGLR